jgi:hypothetical protein
MKDHRRIDECSLAFHRLIALGTPGLDEKVRHRIPRIGGFQQCVLKKYASNVATFEHSLVATFMITHSLQLLGSILTSRDLHHRRLPRDGSRIDGATENSFTVAFSSAIRGDHISFRFGFKSRMRRVITRSADCSSSAVFVAVLSVAHPPMRMAGGW